MADSNILKTNHINSQLREPYLFAPFRSPLPLERGNCRHYSADDTRPRQQPPLHTRSVRRRSNGDLLAAMLAPVVCGGR